MRRTASAESSTVLGLEPKSANPPRRGGGPSTWTGLGAFLASIWLVSLWGLIDPQVVGLLALEPRSLNGLWGVAGMAFVHASLAHLAVNTLPLAGLAGIIALRNGAQLALATIAISLIGGLLLWCFGRSGMHVGASGLVFGYLGFVLARGISERRLSSFLLAILAGVLYGGLLRGLLPSAMEISFEAHIAGFVAGCIAGWKLPTWQRRTRELA